MEMDFEAIKNPLEEQSIGLEKVASFEELYTKLQGLNTVIGTLQNFTPEKLRQRIEQVRHCQRDITFVTRSYQIRKAVERLLQTDLVYKKYSKDKYHKK